jgi:hypothetical protein
VENLNRPVITPAPRHQRFVAFELSVLRRLKFDSIAIPFAGRPDLAWYLKIWGKQVISNDICQWAWWASRALVENLSATLAEADVARVLADVYIPRRSLHNRALGALMGEMDACWFDNVWINLQGIADDHRRALACLHAFGVGDYVLSFPPQYGHLRRPLSEVYLALWRSQRQIINNGLTNQCLNLDGQDFIGGARADLMFARLPRPEGIGELRSGTAGWREIWARGSGDVWEELIAKCEGRLGEETLSKERYLGLVAEFLARARKIPTWVIAHTDQGHVAAGEIGDVVRQFREVEVTYHKDYTGLRGGRNTYLIVAPGK